MDIHEYALKARLAIMGTPEARKNRSVSSFDHHERIMTKTTTKTDSKVIKKGDHEQTNNLKSIIAESTDVRKVHDWLKKVLHLATMATSNAISLSLGTIIPPTYHPPLIRAVLKALVFGGTFAGLWVSSILSVSRAIVFVFALYVATGGWRFLRILYYTLYRDAKSLVNLKRTQFFLSNCVRNNLTVPRLFRKLVRKHPNKVCFYFEDEQWTYQQVEDYSNRVANCLKDLGYKPGEELALFMESRPEFVCLWLGMAKAGIVAALINTNQRLHTLVHSITSVNCKALIFGSELIETVKEIVPLLAEKSTCKLFCLGEFDPASLPAQSFNQLIQKSSPEVLTVHRGDFQDRLFYVYTSGTTGLPKAAIIKHSRFVWMGTALRNLVGVTSDDVIYTCIPLYHLSGGCVGVAQALIHGNTVAIRHRFSASKFWDDCVKYECTVAQYIGELCRYLLAQPERPSETQHKVRLIVGNGLRPQIWPQFVKRFNIQKVGEFYGSTEGNANVINVDNKEGSCGFISQIASIFYPVTLIRVDEETGQPIRGPNGLCIRCGPGEPGEFVGRIVSTDPTRAFDGYVNKSATEKKIVHDVFRKGDMAFLSGDLLVFDEFGYLFFKDRTGDTYRWRGENVSTTEVEAVISQILRQADTVVFGVEIPGVEGKAGMAVIPDPNDSVNLNNLLKEMSKVLPAYAVPLFIRKVPQLETTGTYKLPKVQLQKEGYDTSRVKDPLFFLNAKKGQYVPLDNELYEQIINGKVRL